MNTEELVRASLREQAAATPAAPSGLADRVLAVRRRRRGRGVAGAAAATVLVLAAAVGVPALLGSYDSDSDQGQGPRLASSVGHGDILRHADQSPPRELIAVGDQAVAAYYTSKKAEQPNHDEITTRTYSVLDQKTGRYVVDARWSYLAAAPGMRTAAVLERELPAGRIGLLDLLTGRVTRWIPVPQGVGAVSFSPDGSKLVATTFAKNPDRSYWSLKIPVNNTEQPQPTPCRTGFAVVDLAKNTVDWHALPSFTGPGGRNFGSGEDLLFNTDGTLLYEPVNMEPGVYYRDLRGRKVDVPAREKAIDLFSAPAGLSPDGRLVAGGFAGGVRSTATQVLDPRTGKRTAKLRGQELLAWADSKRLIAWDIVPGGGEYDTRLVLVTLGSDKEVVLSGARTPKDFSGGRWEPVFARR
ncbi:hypothetical protein OG204_25650 [Streptomyces sp. NBC_01387]|uniref:hypothetical protein n=1 Tax=Streptomyces sp. NBC_01387 TaxID=2903849 RepID=UPI00324C1CC7